MSENKQKESSMEVLNTYDVSKTPFSWDKLDGLLHVKSSLITCAEILKVHENTIKKHIKARFELTFGEYADRKLAVTKVRLTKKMLDKALEEGNIAALIFSMKNICGWKDKFEDTNVDMTPIKIEIIPSGNKTD